MPDTTTPELDRAAVMRVVDTRDGQPVVNVKDRNVWARDTRTARFYRGDDELSEAVIDSAYEGARSDFWDGVKLIADEYGYSDVYSAGRSGGWLQPQGPGLHFLELVEYDSDPEGYIGSGERGELDDYEREAFAQRDAFLRFAQAVKVEQTYAETMFVERLQDELDDLRARREACLIRGEN